MKPDAKQKLVDEVIVFLKKIWHPETNKKITIHIDSYILTVEQIYNPSSFSNRDGDTFFRVNISHHDTETHIVSY